MVYFFSLTLYSGKNTSLKKTYVLILEFLFNIEIPEICRFSICSLKRLTQFVIKIVVMTFCFCFCYFFCSSFSRKLVSQQIASLNFKNSSQSLMNLDPRINTLSNRSKQTTKEKFSRILVLDF